MAVNPNDIIEIFLGSFGANPLSGRRTLLVNFRGTPEIDEIVEDETGIYEIVETEDSDYEIVELEFN
ncbi:MAG: hypothetical protein GY861_12515 [bacterium]|nr:hypothetical protein [bacterium]